MTIMTYNIQAGDGMDGVFNLTRQIEVIKEMKADVVGIQEVDNFTARHFVDEASTIAAGTGMQATFAKNASISKEKDMGLKRNQTTFEFSISTIQHNQQQNVKVHQNQMIIVKEQLL